MLMISANMSLLSLMVMLTLHISSEVPTLTNINYVVKILCAAVLTTATMMAYVTAILVLAILSL